MKRLETPIAALLATVLLCAPAVAATPSDADFRATVDAAVRPVMRQHAIPGMAVGLVVDGRIRVFDFGVASVRTRQPVGPDTLFELGSISKTFTATLAALAEVDGRLTLAATVGTYLPALHDRPFGQVRLLDLATHTGGGFPLQVPDAVHDDAQLDTWLADWQPTFPAGTRRTYANPSIGMLGRITAQRMGVDFTRAMQQRLFPALGMAHTFIDVPMPQAPNEALGTTRDGQPVRMTPGVLAAEAYGVRSTAGDMARFVAAQMGAIPLEPAVRRAIATTHVGSYRAGPMTQDLIWEQYPLPVTLDTLLQGNGPGMIFEATPVTVIDPPAAPRQDAWINKTGSTNGFGGYVAFIPSLRLGIVLLANRNYPIEDRVRLAHHIVTSLTRSPGLP